MKTTNPNFPNFENAFAECEIADWWGDFTGIQARLEAYRSLGDGGLRFRWVAASSKARQLPSCFATISEAVAYARDVGHCRAVLVP